MVVEHEGQMDLQAAYNFLLKEPTATLKCVWNDGMTITYFEFVDPPSYTPAAQNKQKVMRSVTIWRVTSNPHVDQEKNHWGFLYPRPNPPAA